MIGGEQPTPLDLRFRLGPIPVRVSVLFWLILALFGYNFVGDPLWIKLLIWVACGFVSILVHELGHALAYRLFGSWASITLQGFGGYALSHDPPQSPWKRLFVSAAGPLAGFALAGAVFGAVWALANGGIALHDYAVSAFGYLMLMNVFWGIFNLLPIRPLDGGNILRELAAIFRIPNPDAMSHGVSFALALVLGIYGALRMFGLIPKAIFDALPEWFVYWIRPGMFMTIWFFLLAYDNFQRLQMVVRPRRSYYDADDDENPPWRRS